MNHRRNHCNYLNDIADILMMTVSRFRSIEPDLDAIKLAAEQLTSSFSGSWMGYHARVYFEGFYPPPPGAVFSPEWGLSIRPSIDTLEVWREYDSELVKAHIFQIANGRNLDTGREAAATAVQQFDTSSRDVFSIFDFGKRNLIRFGPRILSRSFCGCICF